MHHSKLELIDKEKNMLLSGEVMLEPRLQEYLKKKTFYRKNNIAPCISPELEYQITPFDKKIIKAYLSGKKDIHNPKYYDKFETKQEAEKQYFPSREFRNDKRVPKVEKQDPYSQKPVNRGMFVPDNNDRYYEDKPSNKNMMISPRDFPPYQYDGTGYNITESKFNPRIDSQIDPGPAKYHEIHQKNNSQYRINPNPYSKTTDPDPRNKYIISDLLSKANKAKEEINKHNQQTQQQYSDYDDTKVYKDYKLMDDVKNPKQESRYGQMNVPTYNAASEMDLDNKVVVPNIACNSKRGGENLNYRFETYFARKDHKNEDAENELRGMQSYRTHNRSYGYRNPEEHYFQYIDDDFQSGDLSVEPWVRGGEGSRMNNKAMAKNRTYTREIM